MSILAHLSDTAKHWIDALSLGATVATLLSILPAATAILAFVWTALRIVEAYQNVQLNARKLRGEE